MPEPTTLFDRWEDNTLAAKYQELEIDGHMHINHDLFLDLTPDFDDDKELKTDKSAFRNLQRMSPTQVKAWRDAYGPKDEAFHKANLSGDDLVRWKYQRYAKNYLRCVKGVDESVGRLRDVLAELELDDDTVVIYSSDQGFYIGDHGWYDKRWMYEESFKMPLIVNWPGVTDGGAVNMELVQNIDYAPTFLAMAGADIPDDIQGKSLVPLLKKQQEGKFRDAVYYHYYEYPSVHMVPRHYGIRTDRYKLMKFYQFGEQWEMYDLEKDPDELTNIYETADKELVDGMKKKLEDLRVHYDDNSHEPEYPLEKKKGFWPTFAK
jgi:arylsulfatase A-like enzyme